MVCPKCGVQNPESNNFCQSCGASLVMPKSDPQLVSRQPLSTSSAVPPPPPDPLDNVLSRSVPPMDTVVPSAPTPVSPVPLSGTIPSASSTPVLPSSAGLDGKPHGGSGIKLLIIFVVIIIVGILVFLFMRGGIFFQPNQSGNDTKNINEIISQTPVPTKPKPTVSPVVKPSSTLSSQVYTSSKEGFKIYPPQGWQVDESGLMGTLVIFTGPRKDQFTVNINVTSESTQGLDFSSYIAASKGNLPKLLTNYQLLEEKEVAVKGNRGYLLGGEFSAQGFQIRNLQLVVVSNGKAYIATATALSSQWDAYQEVFRSSLSTFELGSANTGLQPLQPSPTAPVL